MTAAKRFITVEEVDVEAKRVAGLLNTVHQNSWPSLYGVPRGGVPAALAVVSHSYGKLVTDRSVADIIIDDIYDSGATAARYAPLGKPFYALFDKRDPKWAGQWLVMPWETKDEVDDSATDIVTRLFQYIGEDPGREGLQETPARFLKAWKEWASGYQTDPSSVLKTFEDGAQGVDEMVIVHNIPIISKCEHHLADIIGVAHIGYIPNGKIVGLSKLARLAEVYSRRLQVQERLTTQIADALVKHLEPAGVGVLIRAAHHCMLTRGVKVHGSVTTTSAMRGALLDKPAARAEFLELCRAAEAHG